MNWTTENTEGQIPEAIKISSKRSRIQFPGILISTLGLERGPLSLVKTTE